MVLAGHSGRSEAGQSSPELVTQTFFGAETGLDLCTLDKWKECVLWKWGSYAIESQ